MKCSEDEPKSTHNTDVHVGEDVAKGIALDFLLRVGVGKEIGYAIGFCSRMARKRQNNPGQGNRKCSHDGQRV
jgi:hypothetical protein